MVDRLCEMLGHSNTDIRRRAAQTLATFSLLCSGGGNYKNGLSPAVSMRKWLSGVGIDIKDPLKTTCVASSSANGVLGLVTADTEIIDLEDNMKQFQLNRSTNQSQNHELLSTMIAVNDTKEGERIQMPPLTRSMSSSSHGGSAHGNSLLTLLAGSTGTGTGGVDGDTEEGAWLVEATLCRLSSLMSGCYDRQDSQADSGGYVLALATLSHAARYDSS